MVVRLSVHAASFSHGLDAHSFAAQKSMFSSLAWLECTERFSE